MIVGALPMGSHSLDPKDASWSQLRVRQQLSPESLESLSIATYRVVTALGAGKARVPGCRDPSGSCFTPMGRPWQAIFWSQLHGYQLWECWLWFGRFCMCTFFVCPIVMWPLQPGWHHDSTTSQTRHEWLQRGSTLPWGCWFQACICHCACIEIEGVKSLGCYLVNCHISPIGGMVVSKPGAKRWHLGFGNSRLYDLISGSDRSDLLMQRSPCELKTEPAWVLTAVVKRAAEWARFEEPWTLALHNLFVTQHAVAH